MKHELCFVCGAATGRAGRADDSIYLGAIGPWCESCYQEARDAVLDAARSDGELVDAAERDALREEVEIRNCTIDHLMTDLAALRDRTTWRPIKDAPTGRDILLWSAADGVYIGDMFHGLVNNPTTHEDAAPTHWLPLPEAPR